YARTVDIHRKPGYDPLELFWDPAARGIPLDARLVRGSHGATPTDATGRGALVGPPRIVTAGKCLRDVDLAPRILEHFT
ncbi:MAG TPA: alkaline phosphatase family protein, partial [Pirellulaceae bacterium]